MKPKSFSGNMNRRRSAGVPLSPRGRRYLTSPKTQMDVTLVLVGATCIATGGGVAAVLTVFACRLRFSRIEATLLRERDLASQTVCERDATLLNANATLTDIRLKHDTASAMISRLEAEKGRLMGEQVSLEAFKTQLSDRDHRIDDFNARVILLESAKADLEQQVQSLTRSKQDAIDAKDEFVTAAIAAKDKYLDSALEAQAESFRKQSLEKERSLTDLLSAKDCAIADQRKLLADAEQVLTEKFSALSLESLRSASADFLKLANERLAKVGEASKAELEKRQEAIDGLLKPVAETLEKLNKQHSEIEERRVSAFDAIEKGIKTLAEESDQLANALRKPTARGAWGEMNLQVILENAGLIEGEHFHLQDSTEDDEGGRLRTDVILHLPNGRDVVIDSKAPLESFWDGMNCPNEETRAAKFQAHARLVREHVKQLSSKAYWTRYESSPDCVVMFIPTEGAYQAAIEADRSLLTDAHKSRVYLANPMTIVNMIHLTAYVLKEERLKQNAQEVQSVASELYRRLVKLVENIESVGRSLNVTVKHYNATVGSLDRRVLPQARKIHHLAAGSGNVIDDLAAIEIVPRSVLSQEAVMESPDIEPPDINSACLILEDLQCLV